MNSTKLIIVSAIRTARDPEKVRKSTLKSKTRLFFEAADEETEALLESCFKKPWIGYRKMVKDALAEAGVDMDQKYTWNELAGSLKGDRPGFILEGDKGHEIHVVFKIEAGSSIEVKPKKVKLPSWSADIADPNLQKALDGLMTEVCEERLAA